jgi:hypothetical protein
MAIMARDRSESSALNRFQHECVISGQEMSRGDNALPDNELIAELVARRWKEEQRYLSLHATNRGAGLQASWLRQSAYGDLALHWSLLTRTHV